MITQNRKLTIYLSSRIGKFHKMLHLYEEKERNEITEHEVKTYVESLIFELNGCGERMCIDNVPDFESIMNILTSIKNEISKENIQPIIKRESFKCIDITKRLIFKLENGDNHE